MRKFDRKHTAIYPSRNEPTDLIKIYADELSLNSYTYTQFELGMILAITILELLLLCIVLALPKASNAMFALMIDESSPSMLQFPAAVNDDISDLCWFAR
jgi:hypothetical protein